MAWSVGAGSSHATMWMPSPPVDVHAAAAHGSVPSSMAAKIHSPSPSCRSSMSSRRSPDGCSRPLPGHLADLQAWPSAWRWRGSQVPEKTA